MVFSPPSSTVMMARPVVPARRATDVRSTPAGLQFAQRHARQGIVADGTDKPHRGAGAPRGQRLVGALAAGDQGVVGAVHGLARPRQACDAGDQIDVDRAEDCDHGSRSFFQAASASASIVRIQAAFSSV